MLSRHCQIAAVSCAGEAARHERAGSGIQRRKRQKSKFMKPCSSKRKLIVCLALDILDESKRNRLRAHLSACEGCRSYLRSISNVTGKLGATKPGLDVEPSQSFHRDLVKRLEGERSLSFSKVLDAAVRMMPRRHRGVALAALACIGMVTWVLLRQQTT